ncbi:MAG: hypothetical protein HZB38_16090, partial [Planctomycetes bacterium]|nr:hypothetical protein [Planctomycetota bacterium]
MRILLLMATASLTIVSGGCEKLPDESASASKAGAPPPLVRGTPINNPAAVPVAETRGAEPAATGKPAGSASLPVPQKPKSAASPVGRPDPDHGGYLLVQFEDLAGYDYNDLERAATSQPDGPEGAGGTVGTPAAPQTNAQIPARIMALNGRPVTLQGFMVPLEF